MIQRYTNVEEALAYLAEYESFDNHGTATFQSCHRKGYYHLVGPFGEPLALKVGEAANFGTVWHAGLAAFYSRHNAELPYPRRLIAAVRRFNDEWQKLFANNPALGNKYKLTRGVQQLILYLDHYRSEDQFYKVVDSEVGFGIVIKPRPAEHPFKPFVFYGRIDRVLYRETMQDVVVGETKTTGGDPVARLKEMRIDRQTQGYFKMLKAMHAGHVGGVILDVAQITATKITNDCWARDFVQLREADGELWRSETVAIVEQIRELKTRSKALLGDNASVLATWDRRTAECTHYGLCPYYDLCLFGITADTMKDHRPNVWHPLKDEIKEMVVTDESI